MKDAILLYNTLGGRPVSTEWKFAHCLDILKDSPFINYTSDAEKRDMIWQAESQARQARRARQRECEAREREEGAAPV